MGWLAPRLLFGSLAASGCAGPGDYAPDRLALRDGRTPGREPAPRPDGGHSDGLAGDRTAGDGVASDRQPLDRGLPADACTTPTVCPYDFVYPRGNEHAVEVRGDFPAGQSWTVGIPMHVESAQWRTTVDIPNRLRFRYKFVVDGVWKEDPANPDKEQDPYGGWNSLGTARCGSCDGGPRPDSGPGSDSGARPDGGPLDDCNPQPGEPFDWRDAVLYFVFVDRFLDGDPSNNRPVPGVETAANYQGGDFAGLKDKIDDGYFQSLGVNALWVTSPVDNTESAGKGIDDSHMYSAYHGYWPTELAAVENRFTTSVDDVRRLVDGAHAGGLRVLFDYVMNHVHRDSTTYRDHPDWFWPINKPDGSSCLCGHGCSWDEVNQRKRCWFTDYLPDFNFTVAEARSFSVQNAIAWVKQTGIDGYRLDAIKHVETSWLTDLRGRLNREVQRGGSRFYLVGETFTGDRNLIKEYIDPATMLDGQFDFPLRVALVKTVLIRGGSMADLDRVLNENESGYGAGAIMGTFLGNHDVPRSIHFAEDQPLWGNEWDGGKDRNWSNQPGLPAYRRPFERLALASAVLFTTPGVPLIYYGDEIGLPGAGDPDNRRMMQWSGLSADQIYLRDQLGKLARIRGQRPELRRGKRSALSLGNDTYAYKMSCGNRETVVVLNRGDSEGQAGGIPAGSYQDLLSGDAYSGGVLRVPARSALILEHK